MSCQKFRIEIEEAARGASLGASAAAHVAACEACHAFRAERDQLRALVAGLGRVAAPADFELRLRARIARADEGRARFAWRGFVPGAAWLAVASCLVLALAAVVHFRQAQTQSQPVASSGDRAVEVAHATPTLQSPPAQQQANDEPRVVETGTATNRAADRTARLTSRVQNAPRRQKTIVPREALEEIAKSQPTVKPLDTNLMSVTGAKIYVGSPIALSGTMPERKLEVLFKDTRGAQRMVAVDPVTFGAHDHTPPRANMKNVSYTGVW
jgi:hypothetical protein